MAPPKQSLSVVSLPARNTISTRSKTSINNINPVKDTVIRGKRKADCSPSKEKSVKRSAFGDVTNALKQIKTIDGKCKPIVKLQVKKVTVQAKTLNSIKTVKSKHNENLAPPNAPNKIATRATNKQIVLSNQTALKPKEPTKEQPTATKKRLSNEFDKEKTEDTLYCSALEEIAKKPTTRASINKALLESSNVSTDSSKSSSLSFVAQQLEVKLSLGNNEVPANVHNFDKENLLDVFQVSEYAADIFSYMRDREDQFQISDYMERQICLSKWMRSLLVDWMVEIQESFELNHETLYLGVKLVDMYLSKMTVSKDTLQLVGAAAMFIASKFDERIPPMIDDFLYICDGAYSRRELVRMEINLLKICGYDLGIPISYRFLRRYARCAKITMPILTLARYVLENSLMDYATITLKDSKVAAAALFIALRMKKICGWTKTLEFYSGYKLSDIIDIVHLLNDGLHKPVKDQLKTVRNKYSHKIFYEVAKTPLLNNHDLVV